MINICFWNVDLNYKADEDRINKVNTALASLILKRDLDILAVCEFPCTSPKFLKDRNIQNKAFVEASYLVNRNDTRLFFSKNSLKCSKTDNSIVDQDSHCVNRFLKGTYSFNMACIHLPSKLHKDENSRTIIADSVRKDIIKIENNYDKNTIIVGDFNSDPYERTLQSLSGFHATMDKKYARAGRIFNGTHYEAFYNPMWNLYGDMKKPIGTYYLNKNEDVNQYWYLLDQVILRPDMIDVFKEESLEIIEYPIKGITDHFPIFFSISI